MLYNCYYGQNVNTCKGDVVSLIQKRFFFLKKSFVFKEKIPNSPHVVKTLLLVLVDFCSFF